MVSKYSFLIVILLLVNACNKPQTMVPGTNLPVKIYPMPELNRKTSTQRVYVIIQEVLALNKFLGTYPPKYSTEVQRDQIYRQWKNLLLNTHALKNKLGETEHTLSTLASLYRQGHNLDVKGAADLAEKHIEKCLQLFPQCVPCHFASLHFYPSANPKLTPRAERSLNFLRTKFPKGSNESVERGHITVYMFRGKYPQALEQIDFFLSAFPNNPDKESLLKLKEAIQSETLRLRNSYSI